MSPENSLFACENGLSSHRTKRASLTIGVLYSMWQDGENKLQAIIRFLRSQKASMKDYDRSYVPAAAAQSHADGGDNPTEWSDDEADNGEAAGPAPTSTKTAQKQKSKKKSKKAKGRGRK